MKLTVRRAFMKLFAGVGMYTVHTTHSGKYYYVTGPLLQVPRFACIAESLEFRRDLWTKDWTTGKPTALLWFSFWKLKMNVKRRATFAEVDWFYGFQWVASH